MDNKNIGILEYYFTLSGEKSVSEEKEVLKKAEKCLRREGAREIVLDEKQNILRFKINIGKTENILPEYELDILPGEKKIRLKQILFQNDEKSAINSMKWYIRRRNERIPKGMKYYVSPVRLECDVSMNDGWENELLRRIIDMLCTVNDDYDMLGHLGEGAVPEEVQCAIRKEYKQYEGEIRNGLSIRKNDAGFKRTEL